MDELIKKIKDCDSRIVLFDTELFTIVFGIKKVTPMWICTDSLARCCVSYSDTFKN